MLNRKPFIEDHRKAAEGKLATRLELLKTIQVSDDEFRLLGQDRARSIRDFLVGQEHIPEERIFLVEPNLASEAEGQTVRSNLTLTAQ